MNPQQLHATDRFLNILSSSSPPPGACYCSVSRITISRVDQMVTNGEDAAVQEEVNSILAQSEELRTRLHRLVDADAEAFGQIMDAYRLPKATEEEKQVRSTRIQEATIAASLVPLEIARDCARVVDLALPAARVTNAQAIGDVAMAAYLAEEP